MLVKKFMGMNCDEDDRNTLQLEYACNVGIGEGGELGTLKGNTRINATALSASITGLKNYRPPGATAGTVLIVDDGSIQT